MKKHKHEIGDIVNNTLIIVRKTRHGKENRLAYEVQSVTYPDAPTYIIMEKKLNIGQGCAYTSGNRIYEGNSLWGNELTRRYIVDIDRAKTMGLFSNKKIEVKCPDCPVRKTMLVSNLTKQGFVCNNCSKGTSYPELFFMSYLEVKGIEYKYQKSFDNLPGRRFDFYIPNLGIFEINGMQHYQDSGYMKHEETKKSDDIKIKYCKDNKIDLIWLDCRESTFEFIYKRIDECDKLPSITENDIKNILKQMDKNKRYPTKDIIKEYKKGFSSYDIAEKYHISPGTVRNVLRKNNIEIRSGGVRKRKVVCITTNEVFTSATAAAKKHNISINSVLDACNNKIKYTGKITGNILYWKFLD